jgi:hypothetical protein
MGRESRQASGDDRFAQIVVEVSNPDETISEITRTSGCFGFGLGPSVS